MDFNQAIRINPQYAEAYCNGGITNKAIGEYQKAHTDLERAFDLATQQGNQELAQDARRLLDDLPPPGGAN